MDKILEMAKVMLKSRSLVSGAQKQGLGKGLAAKRYEGTSSGDGNSLTVNCNGNGSYIRILM